MPDVAVRWSPKRFNNRGNHEKVTLVTKIDINCLIKCVMKSRYNVEFKFTKIIIPNINVNLL